MLGWLENNSLNNLEKAHKIQKIVRKRMQKNSKIVGFVTVIFCFFIFIKNKAGNI